MFHLRCCQQSKAGRFSGTWSEAKFGVSQLSPRDPELPVGTPLPLGEEHELHAAAASLTPVLLSPTAAYRGTCTCEEVGTKVVPMKHLQ